MRNSKTITFTNDIQTMDLFNKRPEQLSVEEFVWLTTQISNELSHNYELLNYDNYSILF